MIYKSTPLLETKEEDEYTEEEETEIEEKWRKESARRRASLERRIRSWERRKQIWERREEFEQKERKKKGSKGTHILCFNFFRGKPNPVSVPVHDIKDFLEPCRNIARGPETRPGLPYPPAGRWAVVLIAWGLGRKVTNPLVNKHMHLFVPWRVKVRATGSGKGTATRRRTGDILALRGRGRAAATAAYFLQECCAACLP